jgi:hypothetical protein
MPYTGLVKLFPEVSELFKCAVFQLVIIHKMTSLECILEGAKRGEVRGWYMGTVGRMRENCLYSIVVIASIVRWLV